MSRGPARSPARRSIPTATLTNGVRSHLRSMDFKKDEVLVRIVLAGGVPWETAGSRGLTDVAALAFQQPATSRLSSTEIRDLLTGRNVKLSGGAALDSVVLDLGGSPEDIEEGFRLVHALLTDPVIEPAALETWRESTRQRLESQRTDVRAQLGEATNRLLSGDDLRFRPLTPALLDGLTVVDGQRWLDRLVRSAPIEVAVVGDIGRERALELVLKYLGSLPARDEVGPLADDLRRVSMRPGPLTKTVEVDTVTPTAATLVGWRGADWTDVKERRCLQLAAQIITSRLREELRQKRGLAYSPYCTARAAQTYPGTGLFASFLAGDPANVAEAVELMRNVMEGFAKDGPTEQEMATVRKQFANDIETQQKEPRYWLGVLSEADYIGTRLSDVKEVMARYTGYTGKDLQRVARKYMTDERRVEVTARPR
jgi:zinc protease